jgi:hypothetical protein
MKILTINCKPDLSYFTSRGLILEATYKKVNKKFPEQRVTDAINAAGKVVQCWCPNVYDYCNQYLNTGEYDMIIVGWNRRDYSSKLKNCGGFTESIPLVPKRTYVMSYCLEDNDYAEHEIMHSLCKILLTKYGKIVRDYMDTDKFGRPYYKNDKQDEPDSNFNQTWEEINPYINLLNGIPMKIAILTRQNSDDKQTLGDLVCTNGNLSFSCKTLELPWLNNAKNISCIPKGIYRVKKVFSVKFGFVYEITSVDGRTVIYIHQGNYFTDIQGCVLVGNAFSDINKDGKMDVINSKITRKALETFFNFEDFNLIIK